MAKYHQIRQVQLYCKMDLLLQLLLHQKDQTLEAILAYFATKAEPSDV